MFIFLLHQDECDTGEDCPGTQCCIITSSEEGRYTECQDMAEEGKHIILLYIYIVVLH